MKADQYHIVVLLRECRDPQPPAFLSATGGLSPGNRDVRLIPNPADLGALERALQLKDSTGAGVTVVAVGPERLNDTLRMALSIGADRAIRVDDLLFASDDTVVQARLLARIGDILSPPLLFTGYRLQDRGVDLAPALAAAQSGRSSIHSVISMEIEKEMAHVLRKTDRGGRQQVISPLPCTLLFEESECTRYPSLEAILQSLETPIEQWGSADLGLSFVNAETFQEYTASGGYALPRPDPIRVATPNHSLPAFDRISTLLGGGIKPRQGRIHFLTAAETADALLAIIQRELAGTGEAV